MFHFKMPNKQQVNPEESASFLSKIFFCWFNTLILKGYNNPLLEQDVFPLSEKNSTQYNYNKFEWNYSQLIQSEKKQKVKEKRNVIYPIIKTFYLHIILAGLFKLISTCLVFANPILLNRIISFMSYGNYGNNSEPWLYGIMYASLLLIISCVTSISNTQYDYQIFTIGMRIRACLISLVYHKSLTISPMGRKKFTTGEIINIISVDVVKIMTYIQSINLIWIYTLQIIMGMYLLWQHLSVASLVSLLVMVLFLLINGYIAAQIKKLQRKILIQRDKRIKLMNEILSGVKALKLYAWEESFLQRINTFRKTEIKYLWIQACLSCGVTFAYNSAPFFMTLASFAYYTLIDSTNILDAQKVFVSISIFNILRRPYAYFPQMINSTMLFLVSLDRINKYLNCDDLKAINEGEPGEYNQYNVYVFREKSAIFRFIKKVFETESSAIQCPISVTHAYFQWNNKYSNLAENHILSDITLKILPCKLVAIVGSVGSGKSSLLLALLGEMYRVKGEQLSLDGSVAYVPQQPWIFNGTFRENVLFGRKYDPNRYKKVIEGSALEHDIHLLTHVESKKKENFDAESLTAISDITDESLHDGEIEIGEKGVNLSGGQKQRISLARAVYSDAQIYLLDDPLSSVDSNVAKHIFDQVLSSKPNSLLRNKTRMLVTHRVTLLPYVDQIVMIKKGQIVEVGSYRELIMNKEGDFVNFLMDFFVDETEQVVEVEEYEMQELQEIIDALGPEIIERRLSREDSTRRSRRRFSVRSATESEKDRIDEKRNKSRRTSKSRENQIEHQEEVKNEPIEIDKFSGKLKIEKINEKLWKDKENDKLRKEESNDSSWKLNVLDTDEKSEIRSVKWIVYREYMKLIGKISITIITLFYILSSTLIVLNSYWLSEWANDATYKSIKTNVTNITQDNRLIVYASIGILQTIFIILATLNLDLFCLNSSKELHKRMLNRVMRASMAFFDVTPIGRILNRFAQDVDTTDNLLIYSVRMLVIHSFRTLSTIVIIAMGIPILLVAFVPLGLIYYIIQKLYISTSRQLRRLESTSLSPIYSHFNETIFGGSSIRAYKANIRFIDMINTKIDLNNSYYYAKLICDRWLSIRLELLGNLVVFLTVLLFVFERGDVTPGQVGLSISFAMTITATLYLLVRGTSDVENNIVAAERIREYTLIEQESEMETKESERMHVTMKDWPHSGEIAFCRYSTRYRDGLDPVLKQISLVIPSGERVAIVGRTGAGKSSLVNALFRIINSTEGTIHIDGIDINTLELRDLRSRLTIIPQEPILFNGTIRYNLDPLGVYSDTKLWKAVENAHLKTFISSLDKGLDHEISENGDNLCVGQKQLICLARALLKKSKVVILDEATGAIDLETEELIQMTIREYMTECTVLTIAHRLNTIMDYGLVMVIEKGNVVEYDTPDRLMSKKDSLFYNMVQHEKSQ